MKRGLLIIGLGFAFLVVVTAVGTFVTNYMPTMKTPQTQTTQAGSYSVILRVDPNPPSTNQPASLSIQIQQSASHQSVNGARVTLSGSMSAMEMNVPSITAQAQGTGKYLARVPFSMSGSWQMQILIVLPGQPTANAVFNVTVQ